MLCKKKNIQTARNIKKKTNNKRYIQSGKAKQIPFTILLKSEKNIGVAR